MYAELQPFSWRWIESSKSSVSEFVGKPADALERLPAEQHVRAAAEHGIEPVLAAADGSEEQRLLRPGSGRDAIVLGVRVVLRSLNERDLGLLHPSERRLEEARIRDVVGVEHGDERGVRLFQGVVDVARLRALVLGAA